jgi:hypothetical protein
LTQEEQPIAAISYSPSSYCVNAALTYILMHCTGSNPEALRKLFSKEVRSAKVIKHLSLDHQARFPSLFIALFTREESLSYPALEYLITDAKRMFPCLNPS